MRAQKKVIGALGAAFGVVIALTAVAAPASARPAPDATTTVTSSLSCASFEGVKITAPWVSFSAVSLQAGETLSVTVSPAATNDKIFFVYSVSGTLDFGTFLDGPATQSYSFRSPVATVLDLSWSYLLANNSSSSDNREWTFDCSSSTTPAATAPVDTVVTPPVIAPAPVKGHGKSRGK